MLSTQIWRAAQYWLLVFNNGGSFGDYLSFAHLVHGAGTLVLHIGVNGVQLDPRKVSAEQKYNTNEEKSSLQ